MMDEKRRERYIQVARQEAVKLARQRGDVVAVFICGSIARGNPEEYSDVDLRVVLSTEDESPKKDFVSVQGVPLEWSYRTKSQYGKLMEVLHDPYAPLELVDSVILYDPDDFIRGLIEDVRPVYKRSEYVKARVRKLVEQPKQWMPVLRERSETEDEYFRHPIYAWNIRCVITLLAKAALILANMPPGGMKLFVSLRTAAEQLGNEELFSLGLDAMGAGDVSRGEVEKFAADTFKAFDYVNSSLELDRLIFSHLLPDKRQYWEGGIRWLIENGFHREAVWSLITLAPVCLVEIKEAGLESEITEGCISGLRRLSFPPFGDTEERLDLLNTWIQETEEVIERTV